MEQNKKITQNNIDNLLDEAKKNIDNISFIKEEGIDTDKCPFCKSKNIILEKRDEDYLYYRCNDCKKEFCDCINENEI